MSRSDSEEPAAKQPSPCRGEEHFLKPTTRSVARRAASPQPSAMLPPKSVLAVRQMTVSQRVKAEWADQQRAKAATSRKPFGSSQTRLAAPLSKKSPQMLERDHHAAGRAARLAARPSEQGVRAPHTPRFAASGLSTNLGGRAKSPGASAWAKAPGDRHTFQFAWKGMPTATPQPSLRSRAPGTGAYGDSTSYIKTAHYQ
jgi:hypothetical protein